MQFYIQTNKGHKIYLDDLENSCFDIEDIAHSLSNLCRWTGHTNNFYSVAQHSFHVSENCINQLDGLMHDATEGYLNDISSPVKKFGDIQSYLDLERRVHIAIANKFKFNTEIPVDVKYADTVLLFTEKRDLFNFDIDWEWGNEFKPLKKKIIPWAPKKAKTKFLDKYYELVDSNK